MSMNYHNAGRHQSHGDDGKRDQDNARAISCRSEPTDQADVCHDHDSLPQLEVGDLFLKPIEFRHGCPRLERRCQDTSTSPYAPSNLPHHRRAPLLARARVDAVVRPRRYSDISWRSTWRKVFSVIGWSASDKYFRSASFIIV